MPFSDPDLDSERELNSPLLQAICPKLTPCRIREYQPDDLEDCLEIYRSISLNSKEPEDLTNFAEFLELGTSYYLVVEYEGDVIACGGLELIGDSDTATLVYGLVHGEYQRRGFGTTLLAARIALLEPEDRPVELWISTNEATIPFYGRFGFSLHSVDEHRPGPQNHPALLWLGIDDQDILDVRTALTDRDIFIHLNEAEDDEPEDEEALVYGEEEEE